jgi:hypothetical protein
LHFFKRETFREIEKRQGYQIKTKCNRVILSRLIVIFGKALPIFAKEELELSLRPKDLPSPP